MARNARPSSAAVDDPTVPQPHPLVLPGDSESLFAPPSPPPELPLNGKPPPLLPEPPEPPPLPDPPEPPPLLDPDPPPLDPPEPPPLLEPLLDPEPLLELLEPRSASCAPLGVPTPVGPSHPGPAVHWMLPHEPLLPLVMSWKAEMCV